MSTGVSAWSYSEPLARADQAKDITVWLHSLPDVNADSGRVACSRGVTFVPMWERQVDCPMVTGVRYVTFQVWQRRGGRHCVLEPCNYFVDTW